MALARDPTGCKNVDHVPLNPFLIHSILIYPPAGIFIRWFLTYFREETNTMCGLV